MGSSIHKSSYGILSKAFVVNLKTNDDVRCVIHGDGISFRSVELILEIGLEELIEILGSVVMISADFLRTLHHMRKLGVVFRVAVLIALS